MDRMKKLISFTVVLLMVLCVISIPKLTDNAQAETAVGGAAEKATTTIYGYSGAGYAEVSGNVGMAYIREWSAFNADDTKNVVDFGNFESESDPYISVDAAEYYDGRVYGFTSFTTADFRFFWIDFEDLINGNLDYVEFADYTLPITKMPVDMAYDYHTGTMYLMTYGGSALELLKVDLTTGETTSVGNIHGREGEYFSMPYSLAINEDGDAYVILSSTNVQELGGARLAKLDLRTCETTIISDLGVGAYQQQSMCFDHDTGDLYWAQYFPREMDRNSTPKLYRVDVEKGTMEDLGPIGGEYGRMMRGMFIPNYDFDPPRIPG